MRQGDTMHDQDGTTALARRLRDAAELAPEEPGFVLADVRRLGRRRIRVRRALTTGAGVAVLVTAAIGASVAVSSAPRTGGDPDGNAPGPVAAAPRPSSTAPTRVAPVAPAESTDPPAESTAKPLGVLIKTSTAYEGGKLTLWFSRSAIQDNRLQLSLGTRDTEGRLRSYGDAVKLRGDDLTPGFGAGYDANSQQPRAYALFGWVVGDVRRVQLDVDGRSRTAQLATWSENPRVHVWWALGPELSEWPAQKQPALGEVKGLTAYDGDGKIVARNPNGEGISRG